MPKTFLLLSRTQEIHVTAVSFMSDSTEKLRRVPNSRVLSEVIKFGWTAVYHKRLGMALKLGLNLTLEMASNVTNLPVVIAAKLEGGKYTPYLILPIACICHS